METIARAVTLSSRCRRIENHRPGVYSGQSTRRPRPGHVLREKATAPITVRAGRRVRRHPPRKRVYFPRARRAISRISVAGRRGESRNKKRTNKPPGRLVRRTTGHRPSDLRTFRNRPGNRYYRGRRYDAGTTVHDSGALVTTTSSVPLAAPFVIIIVSVDYGVCVCTFSKLTTFVLTVIYYHSRTTNYG